MINLQTDRSRVLILKLVAGFGMMLALVAQASPPRVQLEGRVRDQVGTISSSVIAPGAVLRSGDELRLKMTSWADGYLYVISLGSSGTATLLHPFTEGAVDTTGLHGDALVNAAKIQVGETVLAPSDGGYLPLDDRPGKETFIAFVAEEPVTSLTPLMVRMEGAAGDSAAVRDVLVSAGLEPATFGS
jgi:hypothetical protein